MRRGRKTGLTEQQKKDIFHYDQLSEKARRDLSYNVRQVADKELEDMKWLMEKVPDAFKRQRYREFQFPLEAVMPRDPKRPSLTKEQLVQWRETIHHIEILVETFEYRAYRKG